MEAEERIVSLLQSLLVEPCDEFHPQSLASRTVEAIGSKGVTPTHESRAVIALKRVCQISGRFTAFIIDGGWNDEHFLKGFPPFKRSLQ